MKVVIDGVEYTPKEKEKEEPYVSEDGCRFEDGCQIKEYEPVFN